MEQQLIQNEQTIHDQIIELCALIVQKDYCVARACEAVGLTRLDYNDCVEEGMVAPEVLLLIDARTEERDSEEALPDIFKYGKEDRRAFLKRFRPLFRDGVSIKKACEILGEKTSEFYTYMREVRHNDTLRKTFTEEVIKTLKECWKIKLSDAEACRIAGVSYSSLGSYFDLHPELEKNKAQLKDAWRYRARKKLYEASGTSAEYALKTLAKIDKATFGNDPVQQGGVININVLPSDSEIMRQTKWLQDKTKEKQQLEGATVDIGSRSKSV